MTHQANHDNICASSSNPIQVAKQEGWRTAAHILASQSGDPASDLEYITTERSADFRFILPVTGNDSVIDICGGWGSTTAAFARIARHVFSLHSSPEKLAFTGVRCNQEELNNVTLIQSSPINIPLPAQICQIALLTEPLACGLLPNANSESCDHQLQIFKSIYRVLTPGGSL